MAVWVDVRNDDLGTALRRLNQKIKASGLTDEMKWRQHHITKSKRRFLLCKQAYNNEMTRRINEKLYWLKNRRYVEHWCFTGAPDVHLIAHAV